MASKKPVVLKLNGKPFSLLRPSVKALQIKAELDALPSDEIFTKDQLKTQHIADYVNVKELAGYSLKVGARRYWGNPKAIAALSEQVGQ